jgi:hypothetical protein
MGWSLSWAAVKSADAQTVCSILGLRQTGKKEDIAESKVSGTALPTGWYVVVFNRTEIKDSTLEKLSQAHEVIGCFVEEHVMCSSAAYWKNGQQIWRVFHNGGDDGVEHLQTGGQMPAEFATICQQQLTKQQAETVSNDELGVDHIFDLPLNLAKALTGFQHDDPASGLADQAFEALESGKQSGGGFFSRLFGKTGNP